MKASNNSFPSIVLVEGTEPSAPSAGTQRVYIDSTTHKLTRTDSGGTEVTIEGGGVTGSGTQYYLPAWDGTGTNLVDTSLHQDADGMYFALPDVGDVTSSNFQLRSAAYAFGPSAKIYAGNDESSGTGSGALLELRAGHGNVGGGSVLIAAGGVSGTGNAGNITFLPGYTPSGTMGHIRLEDPDSGNRALIEPSNLTDTRTVTLPNADLNFHTAYTNNVTVLTDLIGGTATFHIQNGIITDVT